MYPLTPWVKKLLVVNLAAFIVTNAFQALYVNLALFPPAAFVRPWTVITYMFLHAGLTHLVFNMIGLFFFGPRLEQRLGGRDFLLLYFLGGIGGAVFSFFFAPTAAVVGASAAVYAVLLGFAMYWPQERIYIWAILPVPAWLLATALVFLSLYSGISGGGGNTAHFAHLGGLAFGFGFLKWRDWRRGGPKREFQRKLNDPFASANSRDEDAALARWKTIDVSRLHELNREEVQHLVAKANVLGVASLSASERQFLDRMVPR